MSAENGLLGTLNVRAWYKAETAIAAALLLAGAARGDRPVMILGLGALLIGLGEWINHPYRERLHANSYGIVVAKTRGETRHNSPIGILMVVGGLALAGLGGWRLVDQGDRDTGRKEQPAVRQDSGSERVPFSLPGQPVTKVPTPAHAASPTERSAGAGASRATTTGAD